MNTKLIFKKVSAFCLTWLLLSSTATAQSQLYPQHFNLDEVTLLDGQQKDMMVLNARLLLDYDADRLMTPFVRQAGLSNKSGSKYYGWVGKHPSFSNWGLDSWSLEGHVGGHYVSALALAYAGLNGDAANEGLRKNLLTRLEYCVNIMKDCQDAYKNDTKGLKGFIGGQPINQIWTGLYANDLTEFKKYGGWVPFYCQHKVLAGLRDAYLYTGNKTALECFRSLADWSLLVVSKLTTQQMQDILGWEHGGMNETILDAYKLFGDKKYLAGAKKYSHQYMIDGMKQYSATFLDGKHANTQVPKYIGFERIWQEDKTMTDYRKTVLNFFNDVAYHRTVCIGGNSISEHFQSHDKGSLYITNLEGPESCNSNNMLKLSEDLFDDTHDVKYADFYEATMFNHIMSTQDPKTGGYVYFTSLRPQSYRIYSRVNQGMWCCVGTGMENHSKYAHFAYTHSNDTLYVNLFVPSELHNDKFGIKQETRFPFEQGTKLTVTRGSYVLAVRRPSWTTDGGKYVCQKVKEGDVVNVSLPMSLSLEACPDYKDYVAFKYGPILLAARTDTEARLQNEYGGEGRMDHSPGAMASIRPLSSSPLIIGERKNALDSISVVNVDKLEFDLKTRNLGTIRLEPFNGIHHSRYACYFFQGTPEDYANSSMGKADAEEQAMIARTMDYVATGEQQSEAGHDAKYSVSSTSGTYRGETYRDGQANNYVQYVLENKDLQKTNVSLMIRLITADRNRAMSIYIDGVKIADHTVPSSIKGADENGFYNIEYRIPDELLLDSKGNVKKKLTFKAVASSTTLLPGLYYLRLMKDYKDNSYTWNCKDWKTGDQNRVNQSKFTYDTELNSITINAGTGTNNVCLSLHYDEDEECEINATQKYLVVRGTNLATTSGSSYLWWLNGVNRGSSVSPTISKTVKVTDAEGKTVNERVIAWDMTTSGISDHNQGERFSIIQGMTVFGLTSTTGTSVIKYIGFESNVDKYIETVNISLPESRPSTSVAYNLLGQRISTPKKNQIHIKNGKKYIGK